MSPRIVCRIAAAGTLSVALSIPVGVRATQASRPAPPTGASPAEAARAAPARPSEEPSTSELRHALLVAEDSRDASPAGIAPILEALKSKDSDTRRFAVRALGRMERPALAATIAPVLLDPAPVVRAEAADALAQTVAAGGDIALASELLLAQLERETHPLVRGVLAASLGRMPYKDVESVRKAEAAIVSALKPGPDAAPARKGRDVPSERLQFAAPLTLLGGLRGMEALTRLHAKTAPPEATTVALLKELAVAWRSAVSRAEGGPTVEAAARLRRLAVASLVSAGAADAETISTAFGDADDQVRRLAAQGVVAITPVEQKLVERAVRDQSAMVRTAIVLALDRRKDASTCGYASLLLRDPDPQVATSAIDVAGRNCQGNAPATASVAALASRLASPPLTDVAESSRETARERRPIDLSPAFGPTFRGQRVATWQPAAHALVALARLAPDQVNERLSRFISDERWQVRAFAARAAGLAKLEGPLRTLAGDKNDNVREAVIEGLREAKAHDADDVFLQALAMDDLQALLTAAKALEGTPRKDEASKATLDALDRITGEKRETSRDTRLALLDRLEEVGGPTFATRLQPYLTDFDPRVAERAAALLSRWSGTPVTASPRPLARAEVPSTADLDGLAASRFVFTIRDVGRFEVRPLVNEAPLNAWRFARLVRRHYFDGLTIHRVVPNFVLQGGSPGANEYSGDSAFTRDEVGLVSNVRGSVGVSTRGRDTGDGQIFVNLVDNARLDHVYTVFGLIERGVEVIDSVLEGDVIESIEVTGAPREPDRR